MATTGRGRPKKIENMTVEEIVEQGKAVFAEISEAEERPTEAYRRLADLLIGLRTKYQSAGKDIADWRGRSNDYRQAAAQIFEAANIPPDSVDGIQSRIRYHVGARLREIAPPEELKALGMHTAAGAERQRERRQEAEEPRKAPRLAGKKITSRADLFAGCRRVLEDILPNLDLPAADADDYPRTMHELVELTTLCEQLWAIHEQRRSSKRNRIQILATFQSAVERRDASREELATMRQRASEEAKVLSGTPTIETTTAA